MIYCGTPLGSESNGSVNSDINIFDVGLAVSIVDLDDHLN